MSSNDSLSSEDEFVQSSDSAKAPLGEKDNDEVRVLLSPLSLDLNLVLLTGAFRMLFTFLERFFFSFGGVSSCSVSEGAEESLSVSDSESLALLTFSLFGDFLGFILLPLFPLSRSLLSLLSLLFLNQQSSGL